MENFSVSSRLKELQRLQKVIAEKVRYYSENFQDLSDAQKSDLETELAELKADILEKASLPKTEKRPKITRAEAAELSEQLRKLFKN